MINMALRTPVPDTCVNIMIAASAITSVKSTLLAHENANRTEQSVNAFIMATALNGMIHQFVHTPMVNPAYVNDFMLRLSRISASLLTAVNALETGTARTTVEPHVTAICNFFAAWIKENVNAPNSS